MSPTKTGANTPPSLNMQGGDWALLLFLSTLWGGSFFLNGVTVRAVSPLFIVTFRVFVAALALLAFVWLRKMRPVITGRIVLLLLGLSLLNNVIPFSLLVYGQTKIPSGLAAILNATTPFFTMILTHFLTKDEKLNLKKIAGIFIGFFGVVLLFLPKIFQAGGQQAFDFNDFIGPIACILASLSYGLAGVLGRRVGRESLPPLVVAAGQFTGSSLILLPLLFWFDPPRLETLPPLEIWLALLTLALVSTAGAYIIFFGLMARVGATNVSLVTLIVPCPAIILGALFLGERLGMAEIAGFVVIAAGLFVIDGRIFSLFSRSQKK